MEKGLKKKASRSKSLAFLSKPFFPEDDDDDFENVKNPRAIEEKNEDDNEPPAREPLILPRIRKNSISYQPNANPLRKSSVYFAASTKFAPIPSSLDSTAAANFHRRSSIKLNKYINNRCDLTRLNKIPLRRFSLNVPLSNDYERKFSFPEIKSKRKKSLDSETSENVKS